MYSDFTPKNSTLSVLIIDDEKFFADDLQEFLTKIGFSARSVSKIDEGFAILNRSKIDLVFLAIHFPSAKGWDVLKLIKSQFPEIDVIIISEADDFESVINSMRNGAIDYLKKPLRYNDVRVAIERTKKFSMLQQHNEENAEDGSLITKNLAERIQRNFIGISSKIKDTVEMAMVAAQFPDTSVLITGESGTGKENIAKIIHYESRRKKNLFFAVNSSSITDSLLESEFFGHKKGSFTGALVDKKGYFEICDDGTLFLDEIADMPLNLQSKILRAIEEKAITRVGDTQRIQTNFRIISATNVPLDKLVDEKKFRLDLLHRLNTLHIQIPPLRERPEDIEPLFDFFLAEFANKFKVEIPKVDDDVFETLERYEFPGNVRELKNLVERAFILCKGKTLTAADFPVKPTQHIVGFKQGTIKFDIKGNEIELIRKALQECGYNQKATAIKLGITRDALIRRMKKFNIVVQKVEM